MADEFARKSASPLMAKPRRVGKRWRMEIQVAGKKLSSYFDTKQEAVNWSIEQQALHSEAGFIDGRTMAQLFERYGQEVSPTKKGGKWELTRLAKLARTFGPFTVMGLRAHHIEMWRDAELGKVMSSTVNRDLNLLSSTLTKAVRWRWRADNPCLTVERPRDPPGRERVYTADELDLLLTATHAANVDAITLTTRRHELGALIVLALESAARLSEIVYLRWEEVYLPNRYAHLPDTKSNKSRNLPLSSVAVRVFHAIGPRESGRVFGISRDVASNYFRDVRREVGIEDGRFHDLRHTALTRMAASGRFSVLELARISGHSDTRQLLRYVNPSATDLADRLG